MGFCQFAQEGVEPAARYFVLSIVFSPLLSYSAAGPAELPATIFSRLIIRYFWEIVLF
jgi:hypothetical protein